VLKEHLTRAAERATPLDRETLRSIAFDLTGKEPGQNWDRRWTKHQDFETLSGTGLDPKRGLNFTPENVKEYFDMLEGINQQFGVIPASHWWNMDEKGVQVGGGRKQDGKKFYYPKKQTGFVGRKTKYKISSDNLELVTVVECVSAAGVSVPPAFVVKSVAKDKSQITVPDVRDIVDPIGGYKIFWFINQFAKS
jgi:hypothetical protein